MVVGSGLDVPGVVVSALTRRPVLVLWRGEPPAGLPAHARAYARFSDLVTAAQAAIRAEVAGMRLAPGDGVTMPDAAHAVSSALEALIASHPQPLFAPARAFRDVTTALAAHGVPLHLARTHTGGAHLSGADS